MYKQNSIHGTFGILYIRNTGAEVITSCHEFGKFLVFHLSELQTIHKCVRQVISQKAKTFLIFFSILCTY